MLECTVLQTRLRLQVKTNFKTHLKSGQDIKFWILGVLSWRNDFDPNIGWLKIEDAPKCALRLMIFIQYVQILYFWRPKIEDWHDFDDITLIIEEIG